MKISIDTNLKALRRAKGITQQEVADHLGISVQAISKWERNEGYPDISTLPLLASYYDVSVDALLGVDRIKRQQSIDRYKEQFKNRFSVPMEDRLRMCYAAYSEFPNEPEIVHMLVCTLYADGLEKHQEKITKLSQWLLENYNQTGQYFGAVRNLCHASALTGDMDQAKKYAAMGGRYVGTETQLLLHVLKDDEAVAMCKSNISQLIDLIAVNTKVMLENGQFDDTARKNAVEFVCGLYRNAAEITDPVQREKWERMLVGCNN